MNGANKEAQWYKNKKEYITKYRKEKCKNICVDFNLTKDEDKAIYEHLQQIKENGSSIAAYIKQLIVRAMND